MLYHQAAYWDFRFGFRLGRFSIYENVVLRTIARDTSLGTSHLAN
jgi:hypothetical protein